MTVAPERVANWRDHARYGALGLPLAFVALPLYVILPAHYGQTLGVPLALLGAVLLASRLLDALVDPWLGRWADRWLDARTDHAPHGAWWPLAAGALVLALGFAALFFPPVQGSTPLLWWCGVTVTVTCLAFSVCTITHQAWGSRLGGDAQTRARWVAWREGLGVLGVLLANGLAASWGVGALVTSLCLTLALALWALWRAPAPPPRLIRASAPPQRPHWAAPWRHDEFRRLLLLYLVNGVAAAVPATLVLFFIRDVVQREDLVGPLLAGYFLMAALGVPLWVRLIGRWGPSRAWALGMGAQVLAFSSVSWVGPGDVGLYTAVCLSSGFMLGADLTAPGTLLTGVIQRAGPTGEASLAGVFTGWWQLATKLNLALAAGLALPALGWLGYRPGVGDAASQSALVMVYGVLPCLCKALALWVWWRLWARRGLE
ncbi:MAG TPA: MFS transporter [Aquabacterium sp.]|nr:MFS transporter [Aquabacterium sp.]